MSVSLNNFHKQLFQSHTLNKVLVFVVLHRSIRTLDILVHVVFWLVIFQVWVQKKNVFKNINDRKAKSKIRSPHLAAEAKKMSRCSDLILIRLKKLILLYQIIWTDIANSL